MKGARIFFNGYLVYPGEQDSRNVTEDVKTSSNDKLLTIIQCYS